MALVQKLTGFSRSINHGLDSKGLKSVEGNNHERKHVGRDDIEPSSISTEETCHWAAAGGVETVMSPILQALNTPCFSDVPLFTPTSADLFFSPRPVFRCPVSVFISTSQMGNPISPSVLEFMKGLPEY
ncbi:hypothetical protein POTOM_031660 [Populus tomentosa]|uniref:Uncharacterized protein n=1 Tax=Populus tomentosa TaxID=118781 RepID=A0A8X7Z7Q9_POPTO|nr:hypothetical protein POTOM_031660 [Populus tomentosa]